MLLLFNYKFINDTQLTGNLKRPCSPIYTFVCVNIYASDSDYKN